MKQTIALQTPGRSDLDQSSLFSFDQFTAARPTAPVIHRDARFLLVRSGSGVIRLQGREYPLSAGSLAAILPWQISEIVRVDEPLACSVIAYHYDTVARAAHLFRGEDGPAHALNPADGDGAGAGAVPPAAGGGRTHC